MKLPTVVINRYNWARSQRRSTTSNVIKREEPIKIQSIKDPFIESKKHEIENLEARVKDQKSDGSIKSEKEDPADTLKAKKQKEGVPLQQQSN